MWQDPIIKDTRKRRKQYSEQFNHDLDAIYKDIRERQKKSKRKCVSFPAREFVSLQRTG